MLKRFCGEHATVNECKFEEVRPINQITQVFSLLCDRHVF